MKPWFVRLTWLGLLAAAAVWAKSFFFPSPDHVIRKDLARIAHAASILPNEAPLAKLAKTQTLISFFAPDVQVSVDIPGRSIQTFNGREELQQAALGVRSFMNNLRVDFLDVLITVAPDKLSAEADLTATATMPGERIPEVQELKFRFKKIERDWLVSQVETVKTLR